MQIFTCDIHVESLYTQIGLDYFYDVSQYHMTYQLIIWTATVLLCDIHVSAFYCVFDKYTFAKQALNSLIGDIGNADFYTWHTCRIALYPDWIRLCLWRISISYDVPADYMNSHSTIVWRTRFCIFIYFIFVLLNIHAPMINSLIKYIGNADC